MSRSYSLSVAVAAALVAGTAGCAPPSEAGANPSKAEPTRRDAGAAPTKHAPSEADRLRVWIRDLELEREAEVRRAQAAVQRIPGGATEYQILNEYANVRAIDRQLAQYRQQLAAQPAGGTPAGKANPLAERLAALDAELRRLEAQDKQIEDALARETIPAARQGLHSQRVANSRRQVDVTAERVRVQNEISYGRRP